jgi:hypothetical protein
MYKSQDSAIYFLLSEKPANIHMLSAIKLNLAQLPHGSEQVTRSAPPCSRASHECGHLKAGRTPSIYSDKLQLAAMEAMAMAEET